jgi:hypothetical protein
MILFDIKIFKNSFRNILKIKNIFVNKNLIILFEIKKKLKFFFFKIKKSLNLF